MKITVGIIGNGYIVNQVVSVQVEVIDPGILIVQISFKSFQCLRFLEQLHHGIEVKIVTRQAKIFIRLVLGPHCTRSGKEECEDRCDNYFFHGLKFWKNKFFIICHAKPVPKNFPVVNPGLSGLL